MTRPELGDDRDFRDRFRQEIEAAARVQGWYTAQVIDADPMAVPPWMVTAYVPGPSLQQAVREHRPMPARTALKLMAGVAEALQAIHAAGVVHRDLKPSNVLLAPDGPRVIDFGIARAMGATALTRTGMRVGSPQFMAPEQVAGQPPTPATDIFGLGALAAYAVLGRSWARVLSSVLFAVLTVTLPFTFIQISYLLPRITGVAQWGLAGAALVLLWVRPSSAYFAAMRRPAGAPPGPGWPDPAWPGRPR